MKLLKKIFGRADKLMKLFEGEIANCRIIDGQIQDFCKRIDDMSINDSDDEFLKNDNLIFNEQVNDLQKITHKNINILQIYYTFPKSIYFG